MRHHTTLPSEKAIDDTVNVVLSTPITPTKTMMATVIALIFTHVAFGVGETERALRQEYGQLQTSMKYMNVSHLLIILSATLLLWLQYKKSQPRKNTTTTAQTVLQAAATVSTSHQLISLTAKMKRDISTHRRKIELLLSNMTHRQTRPSTGLTANQTEILRLRTEVARLEGALETTENKLARLKRQIDDHVFREVQANGNAHLNQKQKQS